MLTFNEASIIPPHISMQITDAIEQRDILIDELIAIIKKQNNEQKIILEKNKNIIDENSNSNSNNKLFQYNYYSQNNNSSLSNDDLLLNDKSLLNDKCVSYIKGQHFINKDFFSNKIKDINATIDELKAKLNPITPHSVIQNELFSKKKRLLIGEYYFNNTLAKHMAEYDCDRIIN